MADLIFGLDVGWSSSFTALVGVQRYVIAGSDQRKPEHHFQLRHLSRFPHSTSPMEVVDAVPRVIREHARLVAPKAAERAAPLAQQARVAANEVRRARGYRQLASTINRAESLEMQAKHEGEVHCWLAVDASNDRSFADHLSPRRELGAHLSQIVITSGDAESGGKGQYKVSRTRLISELRHLVGFRRLHIPPELPEKEELVEELQGLEEHITAAANLTYRTRQGQNDDLVMALAMACWLGAKLPTGPARLRVIHTPESLRLRS